MNSSNNSPESGHNSNLSPEVWALGGSKGGIGKSLIVSSIGTWLAMNGKRTILIDADFGGANLHSFIGIRHPESTLSDFFSTNRSIADFIIDSGVENLGLVPGMMRSYTPDTFTHAQKQKFFRHIRKIETDVVLIDLGAGTHVHTIDTLLSADKMILVTVPEIISIENFYFFLKNLALRKITDDLTKGGLKDLAQKTCRQKADKHVFNLNSVVDDLRASSETAGKLIDETFSGFRPHLIVNKVRHGDEILIGNSLKHIIANIFNLNLQYSGHIDYDHAISGCINQRKPFLKIYPDSVCAKQIETLTTNLMISGQTPDSEIDPGEEKYRRAIACLGLPLHAPVSEVRNAYLLLTRLYDSDSILLEPLYDEISEKRLREILEELEKAFQVAMSFPGIRKSTDRSRPDSGPAEADTAPVRSPASDISYFTGQTLRQIRQGMGISLEDMFMETKIRVHVLEYLEMEDYAALPPEIYIQSFLTSYANRIGVDAGQVVRDYLKRYEAWKKKNKKPGKSGFGFGFRKRL